MIKIGEYNSLTVVRKADFGYFLDAKSGRTDDDLLLPNSNTLGQSLNVGDQIEVFVYRDSKDRPVGTLKKPLAQAFDVAYLKVVSSTPMGAFADFGLDRDVFIPMKEQKYALNEGDSYLLYLYIDKTGRIAATTEVDRALSTESEYKVGDEVTGIVYGFQTNESVMVAVDGRYRGVILKNEYFTEMHPGFEVKLRVKKIYEDGKLGLTPRGRAVEERTQLEDEIMKYLEKHGGEMPYNDKSSPDDIRKVFNQSKNYFKNALGGLMKKGLITQDEAGTKLKK
ncbi:MAG TPA: S1-like domain-containing RNA-binding protein [Clostridiaceae bacterium]|nr:S1-like domain-containing RNA-binding protein [Clostridiaceae bacterium]